MEMWLLPKGATSVDPNKPLGKMQRFAPPEKRCTNKDGHKNQCKWWFLASDPHQECPKCRRATKRYREGHQEELRVKSLEYWHRPDKHEHNLNVKAERRNDPELHGHDLEVAADRREERRNDPEKHAHDQQVGAEYRAEHQEERAEYNAEYYQEHMKERKEYSAKYRRSAAGRASRLRERESGKKLQSNKRYRANHRAELKGKKKLWNASPMGLLTRALYKMVKGVHWDPRSFAKLGSFQSNEEAMAHFAERFDPSWMSWENQGRHVKGNAYNETWNIGHALPRKIFDQSEEQDLRRCWHPDNLFPQCARQNTELRDALIYTDDELLEMRHLWPAGAEDDLEQLKGLFQYVDHDFINSKLVAEAGPSGFNGAFSSSSGESD